MPHMQDFYLIKLLLANYIYYICSASFLQENWWIFCEHHWDEADEDSTLKQVINEELAMEFLTQPEMRYSNGKTRSSLPIFFR